jgi:hypothetical protein
MDESAAGLTFTNVGGNCRMPGNNGFVEFDFEVTFPVNSSTAAVAIGGLTFPSATTGSSNPISVGTTCANYTARTQLVSGPAMTTFSLYNLSTALTKAYLSGRTVRIFGRYQANI